MRCQVGRCARISHNLFLETDQSSKLPAHGSARNLLYFHCMEKSLAFWPLRRSQAYLSATARLGIPVRLSLALTCTCNRILSKVGIKEIEKIRNSLSKDQRILTDIYADSHTTQPHQREKWSWRLFLEGCGNGAPPWCAVHLLTCS